MTRMAWSKSLLSISEATDSPAASTSRAAIAGLDQYQRDASSRIEGCEPYPDMPGLRDQALAELPDAGRQHRPGRRHRRLLEQPQRP